MRITDVTLTLFAWDDLATLVYAPTITSTPSSDLALVEIRTDEGVTGHSFLGSAFTGGSADAKRLIDELKPLVLGQNPFERERLHKLMWTRARAAGVKTVSAMDIALWDLAGKALGVPIHTLIGTYRDSIPVYASSPAHPSPQAYAEEALAWKEKGVNAYKLHAALPWRNDIACCTAVRDAVGPDHVLMLDASWSYEFRSALKVGRALEELDYYWYEDPLGEWDVPSYVKLQQKLDIPILATELPFAGLETYQVYLHTQATDFLRGSAAFKGGITNIVKAARVAEAFGMNFEIHHAANSLGNVANLHVAMAIRNCDFIEMVVPAQNHRYGVIDEPGPDSQGLIHAPTAPGLGVEIDFDLIEKKKIATLT